MAIMRSAVVLIPLLLLVCILDTGETCAPNEELTETDCGGWYLYPNDRAMKYFSNAKNWYEAQRECKKLNGYLLTVRTPEETNCVIKMLAKNRQQYSGPMWIGIRKTGPIFADVDGYPINQNYWASNQPRFNTGCVFVSSAIPGRVGSHNCFDKLHFLCLRKIWK
ncbi:C-type isolectin Sp-CL4-like [Antennarius striatus]|uniref:C-type isolectin Sp-CL4-like n=1 Tax=Antennarius striatus TaxID=241820 RepID=UPI0035B2B795